MGGCTVFSYFGGFNGFMNRMSFPYSELDPNGSMKIPHDTYEVYVKLVGQKILLAQNEDIYVVEEFLKERGFHSFTTELNGDQFVVNTKDSFQEKKMRENLDVYLQIR